MGICRAGDQCKRAQRSYFASLMGIMRHTTASAAPSQTCAGSQWGRVEWCVNEGKVLFKWLAAAVINVDRRGVPTQATRREHQARRARLKAALLAGRAPGSSAAR